MTGSSAVDTATVLRPPTARVPGRAWLPLTVAATAVAGVLHLAAAAGHTGAGDLVVGFFLLAALAQGGLAVWLTTTWLRPAPPAGVLLAAVTGTVVLLLLYLADHGTTVLADLGLVSPEHVAGEHAAGSSGDAGGHAVVPEGPVAMGGEAPTRPTPVEPLGTAAVIAEFVALAGMLALLPRALRSRAVNAVAAIGAAVWVAWLTGVLS